MHCILYLYFPVALFVASLLLWPSSLRAESPPMTLRITFAAAPTATPAPVPPETVPAVVPTVTPEPGTITLVGFGLLALGAAACRRVRRS